jgi:hypothetical protein
MSRYDAANDLPVIRFSNRWTGRVLIVMALSSLSGAMSAITLRLGWMADFPLPRDPSARLWLQVGGAVALALSYLVGAVGFASTLLYGIARTGREGEFLVLGRCFHGLQLGLVYLLFFAAPWLALALLLLSPY